MNELGIAVDVGTTTIDYCLVDLSDEHVVAQSSFQNPQSLYGSDVINRILTITRDASYADVLKNLVLDALQECFFDIVSQEGYDISVIKKITICGNTTMISILLGLDVTGLGVAPFIPLLADDVYVDAKQLFGQETKLNCNIFLSGCTSAFIGGDILSGIYYLKQQYPEEAFYKKNCLLIDLGTNGELVLYANNQYYGAATACGPAFEGCTRRQRIYGATTLEAISLGVSLGKILPNGSFAQDVNQLNLNGVFLTTDILQSILLAKSAIAAGIDTICLQAGISACDIDTVYLAGGFGFHINIDHAILLGLLPSCFKNKIKVVGNTSLEGAKLRLLDDRIQQKDSMHIFNFAEIPSYQEKFIRYMYYQPIA